MSVVKQFDPRSDFNEMKEKIRLAVIDVLNIESSHRYIKVGEIRFDEKNMSPMAFADQQKAREMGSGYTIKISAELSLFDKKTDKLINKKRVLVTSLPMLTQRMTYILGGREYQVPHQFRRMSGVYTRIADNGEIEAVAAHERRGQLKMNFNRSTYEILIKPVRGSQATVSLYDLLSTAGKSDQEIASKWGKQLVQKNKAMRKDATRKQRVINIAKKMVKGDITISNAKDAATFIFQNLQEYSMDPRITSDVLGRAHTTLSADCLLDAGEQLVNISKGTVKPSSYNNIGHKKLLSPGDLLFDYISRNKKEIQRKIRNRMSAKSVDVATIARNVLTKPVTNFFRMGGETQLVSEADMTNPLATLTGHKSTTVKGMGGIGLGPGMQLGSAQQAHSSHVGFLDPVDTGEKATTGLQLYMSMGAKKIGDRLHCEVFNLKTGKMEHVDPLTLDKSNVAYPDDIEFSNNKVTAKTKLVRAILGGGKSGKIELKDCDYAYVSPQKQFGIGTNLIPFLGNNNGNRVMIGAKMATQAVSLKKREEPLVQIFDEDSKTTLEKEVGKLNSLPSPVDGVISKITKGAIHITGLDKKVTVVQKYSEYATNDPKSMLNHELLVSLGDSVKKGQLLADSNYTRNGTLALGTNLNVGYMPMKGYNFEDGVVISRSASDKLSSEHLYTFERDCAVQIGAKIDAKVADAQEDSAIIINKEFFATMCPRSTREYENFYDLDDDGVIKKGAEVKYNNILIAACMRTDNDPTRATLARSSRIKSAWRPAEIAWEKENSGVVSKVIKTGKLVKVYVRTAEPMKIGDKLVGRYGNKGIVTKVLEDHEMPYTGTDKDGKRKHLEVALHPAGMPGRINIGQLMETAASKIAEKTGKPYVIKSFDNKSKDKMRELIAEMKKHGVSDQELVRDPKTDKILGSIISGKQYIQKLTHQVDKKMTSRPGGMLPGISGYKYDINNQPKSGAPTGGQAMGALGLYSLLGHNARAFIRDLQTHHSTYETAEKYGEYDSDEYWNSIMNGLPMPNAKQTFTANKFLSFLKAMGVDPVKNGDDFQLVPMSDADVLKKCPHEVKKPNRILRGKDGQVEKGGLFSFPDGDRDSKQWGHIKLAERIINPVFEKPASLLLGIPVSKFERVLSGKVEIGGKTGMSAIVKGLKEINLEQRISELEGSVKGLRKTERDIAYKQIKLLKALRKNNISPYEAYTMKYMPVLPPKMRPISLSAEVGALGDVEMDDINQLYKHVGMANDLVKSLPKEALPEDKDEITYKMYDKVRNAFIEGALDNKGAPINSLLQATVQPKDVKGHKQAKEGFFQAKIIKRRSELSGRSVITPEPELKLDQVGIPRKMAMNIYRPFIIREIKSQGYSTLKAVKIYKEDPTSPTVKIALESAIANRPLVMKRDPSLHKHNVLSFYPKIVEGKSIQIHPLVCGGFNADFDGDTMGVWVPSSDDARDEAKNMLPSKNLFGTKGYEIMNSPEWGAAYGIWQLTELGKQVKVKINSPVEAYKMLKDDKLDIADVFTYKGKKTTAGRMLLVEKLPSHFKNHPIYEEVMYGEELTKKKMKTILTRIAREKPELYPAIVDDWKDLGNKYAYEKVWSFGLEDFVAHKDLRDKHLQAADKRLDKMKKVTDADKVREYGVASAQISAELEKKLKNNPNRAWRMSKQSGAMGSKYNQVQQIIVSPLQVVTSDGDVVPNPVRKSYSEGLGVSDYWDSIPGVRTGTLSRVKGTSEPGAKNKDLVNLNISTVVSDEDCGTSKGEIISTSDVDAEARFLSAPVEAGSKKYAKNTLVTTEVLKSLRRHHKTIKVRSPLHCNKIRGVCKLCAGVNELGRTYNIGENAGVASAQSLSEPLTQMAMNAFHTGGSASGAGAGVGDHFEHLAKVMNMPKILKNKATIVSKDCVVKSIKKDTIAGGHIITTTEEKLSVPADKQLFVKVGDKLVAGDPVCSGMINPHELLKAAGINKVRSHLIKEMRKVYDNYGVRQRHAEMLVRNLTSVVRIVKDPLHDHAPDDLLSSGKVRTINKKRKENEEPLIEAKPVLLGINQAVRVLTEGDFMAQLNYQHVRKSLLDGMAHGAKSSLHGHNPIPGMAMGASFGKTGTTGEY
tara:strand:- start:1774 stop:8061 length:6288 start_codon:yes stop_codon:yes gene_type:complete